MKGNLKGDFSVRGELIINEKIYKEKFKDKYTTARHLVNGMVNSKKFSKDVAKHIDFVAYEVLYPRDMTYSDQMKFLKKNKFYHVTHITTKTLDLKYLKLQKRLGVSGPFLIWVGPFRT